jgi:hypothetical protein
MLEAKGSHGLVMDVSKKTNNIMLWPKPKKDSKGHRETKDNQLFKVSKTHFINFICIRCGMTRPSAASWTRRRF